MATFKTNVQQIQGASGAAGQQIISSPTIDYTAPFRQATQALGSLKVLTEDSVREKGREIAHGAVSDVGTAVDTTQTADAVFAQGPVQEDKQAAAQELEAQAVEAVGLGKFENIQAAVRNGTLSQTAANLHVADLVTQRVQAQPVFANRIREAAARTVGFDPSSLRTRALLGTLGTDPVKTGKTALDKQNEQIDALSQLSGRSRESVASLMSAAEITDLQVKAAENNIKLGVAGQKPLIDSLVKKDVDSGMNELYLNLLQPIEDGRLRSGLAMAAQTASHKQQAIAQFLSNPNVDANSADARQAVAGIERRYDAMAKDLEAIGAENVDKARLGSIQNKYALREWETFGEEKALINTFGEENYRIFSELAGQADSPEELEQLLKRYPDARAIRDARDSGDFSFETVMRQTASKMISGDSLSDVEKDAADIIITETTKGGNGGESTDNAFKYLTDNKLPTKATSVAVESSPRTVSSDTRAGVKRYVEQDLPVFINRAAKSIAEADGNIVLNSQGTGFVAATEGFSIPRGLQEPLANLNMILNSYDKGWGTVHGNSKEAFVQETLAKLSKSKEFFSERNSVNTLNTVLQLAEEGEVRESRVAYDKVQKAFPDKLKGSYEQFVSRVRKAEEFGGKLSNFRSIPDFSKTVEEVNSRTEAGQGVLLPERERAVDSKLKELGFTGERAAAMKSKLLDRIDEKEEFDFTGKNLGKDILNQL